MEPSKSPRSATTVVTAVDEPVPDFELYTIPASSSWFQWDSIHDTERKVLKEFFDGSSFMRTPKIYKDYRDFIISKYREDPSRRLTFTEVRKSLVGDVCLIKKVFNRLEKWGLINFNATPPSGKEKDESVVQEDGGISDVKVRVEEGAPNGVRVVAMPNSSKPLVAPVVGMGGFGGVGGGATGVVEGGFKLPPLAAYGDAYDDSVEEKGLDCSACKEKFDPQCQYECTKEKFLLCKNCFTSGNFGENNSADDYKLIEKDEKVANPGAFWSEAETNLLLESVLQSGDDWDLVAQNVKTKTKLQCISRLIELPFGELMLGSHGKSLSKVIAHDVRDLGQVQSTSSSHQKLADNPDAHGDRDVDQKQNGTENLDTSQETQCRPLKKPRTESPGRSLMKQVSVISTMVEPHITTSAAKAAVSALCEGSPFIKDIFDRNGHAAPNELRSTQPGDAALENVPAVSEAEGTSHVKDAIPLSLRMRTSVATALGSAAARARLLSDQEEIEMEYLMAVILETQLKKLHCKINHFEELEHIMDKERPQLEELKESILAERIDILRRIFQFGISRWRDNSLVKSLTGGV